MSFQSEVIRFIFGGDAFSPQISTSRNYKHWISIKDFVRCEECKNNHGKIRYTCEIIKREPPIHPNCRCKIEEMTAIGAGSATINGRDGADWMLKYKGVLPNNYVSQNDLELLGWRRGKKISKFSPGKMLFGGVYENDNKHLPEKEGRIWYEADINYKSGKRNSHRIVWSNDGLIFVTYDHYETFCEII